MRKAYYILLFLIVLLVSCGTTHARFVGNSLAIDELSADEWVVSDQVLTSRQFLALLHNEGIKVKSIAYNKHGTQFTSAGKALFDYAKSHGIDLKISYQDGRGPID
jgi:hypothetical protein